MTNSFRDIETEIINSFYALGSVNDWQNIQWIPTSLARKKGSRHILVITPFRIELDILSDDDFPNYQLRLYFLQWIVARTKTIYNYKFTKDRVKLEALFWAQELMQNFKLKVDNAVKKYEKDITLSR